MITVEVAFEATIKFSGEELPHAVEIRFGRDGAAQSEGPTLHINAESKLPEWNVNHLFTVFKRLGQGPIEDVYAALEALEVACQDIMPE